MVEHRDPAAAEGSPYRRHIPALDGLRGVAVSAVLLAHLFAMPTTSRTGQVVQDVLMFCGVGVVVFFVLSGFLITGILVDSLKEVHYFRKFYVRRALRIFPLYYGVLAVFASTVAFGGKHYGRELESMALYLQNTNLIAPQIWYYDGLSRLPLAHFWTLALEEQFYLLWPVLVYFLRGRRDVLWGCFSGAGLSLVLRYLLVTHGYAADDIHGMTVCRLDTLLGGGALAMLVRSRRHDALLRGAPWLMAGGLLLALLCGQVGKFAPDSLRLGDAAFTLSYTAYALASAGFLVMALRRGGVSERFFSNPGLQWMGRYSYGLYVFHYIFFGLWCDRMRMWLVIHLGLRLPVAVTLAGFGVIVLSIAAAFLSYELYEKPFLRLKHLVSYKSPEVVVATSS